MMETKQINNVACRIFKEQIDLINQLPEKDRANVLYLAVNNAFNQFENQNDNQIENQNESVYVSVSVSVSELGNSVLKLLSKNIVCKEFSNNYGGRRVGSGRKIVKHKVVKCDQVSGQVGDQVSDQVALVSPVMPAMEKWVAYKKERGQSYKPTGFNACLEKLERLSNNDLNVALQIVNESISNNWAGLFPLKNKTKAQTVDEKNWEIIKDTFDLGE